MGIKNAPQYPVLDKQPTFGTVVANVRVADYGTFLGTTTLGSVVGFIAGERDRRTLCLVACFCSCLQGVGAAHVRSVAHTLCRPLVFGRRLCALWRVCARLKGVFLLLTGATVCCAMRLLSCVGSAMTRRSSTMMTGLIGATTGGILAFSTRTRYIVVSHANKKRCHVGLPTSFSALGRLRAQRTRM